MKILINAMFVSGIVEEGGSGRFMKCVADTLVDMGHSVTYNVSDKCDLIICGHGINKVKDNPAYKVYISQGPINAEKFVTGADRYISISKEIQKVNGINGFVSDVVGQPIQIRERKQPNKELKNILIIRRGEQQEDHFAFLNDKYNVKISNPNKPIEEQIAWADLCITLGRGALESMAQGKPVIVADNRSYIGAFGDGYVTKGNIKEIARCNFSGRRFLIPITEEWIEGELAKYNSNDSVFLYGYVKENHDARKIVAKLITEKKQEQPIKDIAFGCMVNDAKRLGLILKNSSISQYPCFTVFDPKSATKGLNILLDIIDKEGAKIGILTHQDMFYREGWIHNVKEQIAKLPDDWVIAGIVGKDEDGVLCGRFHDMSTPLWIVSEHEFPARCSCIDECTIIVNMKSGFRFEEELEGFDLYGTYACLRANEMGSAWILDAWAEHYCSRFHGEWEPNQIFMKMWKWIYDRFPDQVLDSTVLVGKKQDTAWGGKRIRARDNFK